MSFSSLSLPLPPPLRRAPSAAERALRIDISLFLSLLSYRRLWTTRFQSIKGTTVAPFSSCPQSFLASGSFPVIQLFDSAGQSIRASASVLVWYPCSPRDSQEFSPAPQFKSINSLVLSLLYGVHISVTLTSFHQRSKDKYWIYYSSPCVLIWCIYLI